jgi:hypothetical protein
MVSRPGRCRKREQGPSSKPGALSGKEFEVNGRYYRCGRICFGGRTAYSTSSSSEETDCASLEKQNRYISRGSSVCVT